MSVLTRVVIERQTDGTWTVLRERATSGERFVGVDDLLAAFDTVLAAYRPDGTPRGVTSKEE